MCGIAGIVARRDTAPSVPAVTKMVAALAHRGPDSRGVRNLDCCVLGGARLAINDLSERGRQPMCNEDSTVWIVYNGETYNAPELRRLLISHGHRFSSTSDTEVVLHLYEQFGDECPSKLRGMFAFAIWDSRTRKLLLARDRLGIKPLYYSVSDKGLLFASEIKALLSSDLIERKMDPAGLRVFLQLGHIPPPWTAIRGVRPLEPGHIAIWKDRNLKTASYWTLPVGTNGHSPAPAEAARDLHDILLDATECQLMSDVPIALFLSGGADSAALASLLRSAGAPQLTALTIGFEEKRFDESDSSQRTAKHLGLAHRAVRVPVSSLQGSMDHAFWAMDQPTVDGMNAYWISRVAAQEGFKVALSGQGGDELFGGYESVAWFNRFFQIARSMQGLPQVTGKIVFDHKQLAFRIRKLSYLAGADDPFIAAQLAVRLLFLDRDVRRLLNPELNGEKPGPPEADALLRAFSEMCKGEDLASRIAFMDFPLHLQSRLLRDGDAFSMAHSLELRPVFLDHRIVEFVLALPPSVRLRRKQLLLDAIRDCMPAELAADLAQRPKRTFTFPFAAWLGRGMKSTVDAALQPKRIAASGILNPVAVADVWKRYLRQPKSVGWSRLWSLFVVARWCELMKVES